MRILVAGIGSIGVRHAKNLLSLGYTDIALVTSKERLEQGVDHLVKYRTIEEGLMSNSFDTAFVCTPTSAHKNVLSKLLEHNVKNIYVEKPVSNNLDGLAGLFNMATDINARVCIGYDLRFDPGLQKVKLTIASGKYGKPLSVNAVVGQYLPDWRPYEDYTQGTSAKKETGGGVLLDLIHEFDYLYWLFGKVEYVAAHYTSGEALKIETEEIAEVLLKFESTIIGTVHLDYLQPNLVRYCLITCSKGSIYWDMASKSVTCVDHLKESNSFSYHEFDRNDRFILAIKTFLEQPADERLTSFKDGLESLKMVLAAKQSSSEKKYIKPNSIT